MKQEGFEEPSLKRTTPHTNARPKTDLGAYEGVNAANMSPKKSKSKYDEISKHVPYRQLAQ